MGDSLFSAGGGRARRLPVLQRSALAGRKTRQSQTPRPPERGTIRVDVNLVNVIASVMDKNNRPDCRPDARSI